MAPSGVCHTAAKPPSVREEGSIRSRARLGDAECVIMSSIADASALAQSSLSCLMRLCERTEG